MYAFVRFQDDNAKVIVPCNDIKNFSPTGLADFNSGRWYDVWWEDNNQSGYYRAQIIKIFETEMQAREETKGKKRIPVQRRPFEIGDQSSSSSEELCPVQTKNKKKNAQESQLVEIFKRNQSKRLHSPSSEDIEPARKKDTIRRLQDKITQLEQQNGALQAALCSKIFRKEQEQASQGVARQATHIVATAAGAAHTHGLSGAPGQATSVAASAAAGVAQGKEPSSNPRQADRVATTLAARDACSQEQSRQADPVLAGAANSQHHLCQDTCASDSLEPNPVAATGGTSTELFKPVGDEVCMGHGTWMPKTRFEDIMKNNRDSMFVREASVALFSTAGLLGRSVTGMSSNRTKSAPKPALDAVPLLVLTDFFGHYVDQSSTSEEERKKRKASMNKLLARKIADLE